MLEAKLELNMHSRSLKTAFDIYHHRFRPLGKWFSSKLVAELMPTSAKDYRKVNET